MNRKSIKIIIFVLTCLELCFAFLTYKSYSNETKVEEVKEVNKVNRKQFAMYIENETTGEYEEFIDDIYFPGSNYILNKTKSSCEDKDGKAVDINAISFNNGKLKISSNKTLFCDLYFDVKDEAYALAISNEETVCDDWEGTDCYDSYNLVFVRSEEPINAGDMYDEFEIVEVYTGFENGDTASFVPSGGTIVEVVFEDEIKPISTAGWFSDNKFLSYVDATKLNTSLVTDMSYMFSNTMLGEVVGIENWDVANVATMEGMFYSEEWYSPVNLDFDLSNWDVSNVTDMSYMFYHSQDGRDDTNISINFSGWDTSNVIDMSYMFYAAIIDANININEWNTSNVSDMSYMFSDLQIKNTPGANININLSAWNVSSVTNYNGFDTGIYFLDNGESGNSSFTPPVWPTA